jgi:hypothetical protein
LLPAAIQLMVGFLPIRLPIRRQPLSPFLLHRRTIGGLYSWDAKSPTGPGKQKIGSP